MKKKWRILLLDTKKSNPNHYIYLSIKEAFKDNPLTEIIVIADYGNAIARAQANNCNLFLAFDGEELDRSICASLASLCGTSVLWVTEDPYERNINKANSDLFDLIFTNDSGSVDAYGQKGRHLPFAASPHIHFHKAQTEHDNAFLYDLFFVGTAWPNRVELIKRLQSSLVGLKVKLALPYNSHIPAPDLNMDPSAYLWKTPNSEFAKFANRSRITLTLHRSFSSSGNATTAETPGPRLFEVALAGGFQLIDMSLPEVSRYLDEDTQFSGFSSLEECVEKIKFYLSNSDIRMSIAKSAQERALNEHLYSHRLDTIFFEVAKLDQQKKSNLKLSHKTGQRPKILFVTHNITGVQPYGGVEVYQQEILNSLKRHFQFFIYTVDRTTLPLGKKYALYDEHMVEIESYKFDNDIDDTVLSCTNRERTFSEILTRQKIDLVHFQHWIGHVPSLPYISKALGIPIIASLHDYYVTCRHFNLIGYQDRYCNISSLPSTSCDVCLNAKDNAAVGSQSARRAFFGRTLDQIDMLHANTEGVAAHFKAIFPNLRLSNKLRIYGVPMPSVSSDEPISKHLRTTNPVHVAIVGNFTKNKGADVLIHTFNQMRDDKVQFHIFGNVIEPYNTIMQQLSLPNIIVHGNYQPGTIVERLKSMSLSLHLSIWPETYCITLSEAWMAGVVPIVSDIGALGERVTHEVNGFKVQMGEPGPVIEILRLLIAQPSRIESIRAQISFDLFASNKGAMAWLNGLYDNLLLNSRLNTPLIDNNTFAPGISLVDCGIALNQNTWFKSNNPPRVRIHITNSTQEAKSLFNKLRWYKKNYGVWKTVLRIMQKLKIGIKNLVRKNIL